MGLMPTHGDESRVFRRRLIPDGLRSDFRRSVMGILRQLTACCSWVPRRRGRLVRGRSPDRVRRGQVGTKILPQTGYGLRNRAGAGCSRPEFLNSPASMSDDTDHPDGLGSTAMPNVQFRIARMMSSQVPRCSDLVPIIASPGSL